MLTALLALATPHISPGACGQCPGHAYGAYASRGRAWAALGTAELPLTSGAAGITFTRVRIPRAHPSQVRFPRVSAPRPIPTYPDFRACRYHPGKCPWALPKPSPGAGWRASAAASAPRLIGGARTFPITRTQGGCFVYRHVHVCMRVQVPIGMAVVICTTMVSRRNQLSAH